MKADKLTTLGKFNSALDHLDGDYFGGAKDVLETCGKRELKGLEAYHRAAMHAIYNFRKASAVKAIKAAIAAIHENVRIIRHGVETQTLVESGIHTAARITNGGDDSEPAKLCDVSLIQITDDAGKQFVMLATELDGFCKDWLAYRRTHPNAKK